MASHPVTRALFILAWTLYLVGCSSQASGIFRGPTICNPGTQVQLANPTPNQGGVSTGIGQLTIVANGNGNILYNTYGQWQMTLVDNFGNPLTGGQLRLVPYPNGPHPYPSDFYYASSIPQLSLGRTWNAFLTMTSGSCLPILMGSFST